LLVEYEVRHPRYLLRWIPHAAWSGLVLLRVLAARLRGRTVIVHSHSAAFCLLAGYAGRFFGGKAVHTFHSPIGYRSLVLAGQAPGLDALVYVSAATRENYVDVCGSWNDRELVLPGATEIPPPVEAAERAALRTTLERDLGIPASHSLVLSVGRVVQDKGVHVLARAASLLAAEPVSVAVAGPPGRSAEDRRYYEGLPGLAGASARFHLLGEVSPERLRSLYRAADVVAVPSVWAEPAPMTAIEAMAHGLPVVASRIGGLPTLVPEGKAGILVPPDDVEALAEALRRLAHDPALRGELARGARARAEERHSIARFGREHARLYGSL
ncbi:MAG: glycosyltransferase family 4 protein, partial [Candidatus Thermoplasmatota archaeon]